MSGYSFRTLRQSALQSCRWRGHSMKRDPDDKYYKDSYGREQCGWICKVCGKTVRIETHPAPNSIDIHGEAVAQGCKDR